jgi:hypothetical protein
MLSAEGTTIIIASFRLNVTWRSGIAVAGLDPLPFRLRCVGLEHPAGITAQAQSVPSLRGCGLTLTAHGIGLFACRSRAWHGLRLRGAPGLPASRVILSGDSTTSATSRENRHDEKHPAWPSSRLPAACRHRSVAVNEANSARHLCRWRRRRQVSAHESEDSD